MTKVDRLKVLAKYIENMPSLPVTVSKVQEICDNPKTSPVDLYKIISLDPVLMGKVMKLINSAYYGLSGNVTSLVRAIIMLGMNTVKNLALSSAVMGIMSGKRNFVRLSSDQFWEHSLCTGVIAKKIAEDKKLGRKQMEEFFITGLLHDIGKIPLISCFPDEYTDLINKYEAGGYSVITDAERDYFELDHTVTGAMIADSWGLAEPLKTVIISHHIGSGDDERYRENICAIMVSDYFANIYGCYFSGNCSPLKPDDSVFTEIGIPENYIETIREYVKSEMEKARIFLDLKS